MASKVPATAANEPEIRALEPAEVEVVTGGNANCYPIFGEDGSVYSPTLGRLGTIFGKFDPLSWPIL